MAILGKDEFFKKVHERVGSDTSEEALSFLEDITDTYADMERRAADGGDEWRRKYEELDEAWREKYKHRFFSAPGDGAATADEVTERQEEEEITIEDLFKKED